MIDFSVDEAGVEFLYTGEIGGNAWTWRELSDHGQVTISKVFSFERTDLLEEPPEGQDDHRLEGYQFRFRFAERRDGYFHVPSRIFDIQNPLMIADAGVTLERKTFVAERNISIIRSIAKLVGPQQPVIIGGDHEDAIPAAEYELLLAKFPNTGELNRYAAMRVATIVGDYLQPLKDAREQYELYLTRRRSSLPGRPLRQVELLQTEIEKYIFIRDTLIEWLRNGANRSEADWQAMIVNFLLLIFPKYVAVLSNVRIADAYSHPGRNTNRFIDLALVDTGGSIDVIEVKKPFDDRLLARRPYRDNYIPAKELTGGIMQAEKYLFHLSKWGVAGERALTEEHQDKLPTGLSVRITNPKAMIILGRDRLPNGNAAFSAEQRLDLEIIKRKYANMIDVLTYDDLIRRLDNIIESLRGRAAAMAADATV